MRYFLHLSYQGTNYRGYQRQKLATSVQAVVEDCISKMLGKTYTIHGCGRTDAGVHASSYYAHIDLLSEIDFDFCARLNLMLPADIAIHGLYLVGDKANAQRDAIWRTYEYYFHLDKTPSLAGSSSYYRIKNFSLNNFQEGIAFLRTVKDFRSLCKQPELYKHTLCKIQSIQVEDLGENQYKFTITADRFLRAMIRLMVARLMDLAEGKLEIQMLKTIILQKEAFIHPHDKKAPAQGLYLSKVEYPYKIH